MASADYTPVIVANAAPDKIDTRNALQLSPVSVWSLPLAAHRFLPAASVHPLQNREIVRPLSTQLRFKLRLGDNTFGNHQLCESIGHCQRAHHQFFQRHSTAFDFLGHRFSNPFVDGALYLNLAPQVTTVGRLNRIKFDTPL
jgi:hypothetical protein